MAKSNNKSVANDSSVNDFIASLGDKQQIKDSQVLLDMFGRITGKPPVMWGSSMIGYGKLRLTYASGREIEWFNVGFSPRKGKLSLYVTFDADALTRRFPHLGTYTIGKGCIYIKKLEDVALTELEKLIAVAHNASWQDPTRSDGKEQTLRVETLD